MSIRRLLSAFVLTAVMAGTVSGISGKTPIDVAHAQAVTCAIGGPYILDFTVTKASAGVGQHWIHTMNIGAFNPVAGTFSATGNYNPSPAVKWVVNNGKVTGSALNFLIHYTPIRTDYYVHLNGTIGANGVLSGRANDSEYRLFTWIATPTGSNNCQSSSSSSSSVKPQCSDGVDNDGDTKVDYFDPGCYMNGVYNPNDNSEQDDVPQTGCINVTKQTFNSNGDSITPVAQFTFRLENGQTVQNFSNGSAQFTNVPVGSHSVSEIVPQGWQLVSQNNVYVNVLPGSQCASVTFQNRQLYIGGGSSSSSFSYPNYPLYPTYPSYPNYQQYSCMGSRGCWNSYTGYNGSPSQQQGWGWNSYNANSYLGY